MKLRSLLMAARRYVTLEPIYIGDCNRLREKIDAALAEPDPPIDMLLFCPSCHKQHIDAPDPYDCPASGQGCNLGPYGPNGEEQCSYCGNPPRWTNPPHKSHLCHACGTIWRPADVPTNGVTAIKTRGKADTLPPITLTLEEAETIRKLLDDPNEPTYAGKDLPKKELQWLLESAKRQAADFPEDSAGRKNWSDRAAALAEIDRLCKRTLKAELELAVILKEVNRIIAMPSVLAQAEALEKLERTLVNHRS